MSDVLESFDMTNLEYAYVCEGVCISVCIKSNSAELHMQYPAALFTKNMTCVCRVNMSVHTA